MTEEVLRLRGKRVLVTGGAGFIGSHTVDALLSTGADVVVLDNFTTGKIGNLPVGEAVSIVTGDVRNVHDVQKAISNVDAVMHLAAQVSVTASIDDPANSAQHNIMGFVNVLDVAREHGVKRIVYASSAAVYGIPQELPLDEDSAVKPISPYGLEKLVNEQYAAMFASLYGLRCLGLRYFNVYGPRQDPASPYAGVISRFADGINARRPLTIFGTGMQTRDFVYVKDIARVNVAALAGGQDGVVAVGTGQSVSLLELVDVLTRRAGRRAEVHHGPPAPGDITYSAMRPAKLRQCFGWVPETTLDQGLSELLG